VNGRARESGGRVSKSIGLFPLYVLSTLRSRRDRGVVDRSSPPGFAQPGMIALALWFFWRVR